MSAAYYQLLHLCDEFANEHATITITVGAFGPHLDIYRNKVKLGEIPYSQEDAQQLRTHFRSLAEISAPYTPAKKFLRVLKPAA